MEHRRTASFGVYSLLLIATTAVAAPSNEQPAGPYRGMYVCQTKVGAGPGILRVPIDLVIPTATSNLPDLCSTGTERGSSAMRWPTAQPTPKAKSI